MDKLAIRNIRMYNPYWYAIRFTGDDVPFSAMTGHLKSYGHHAAYWRQAEFAGTGAWIVRKDILERHTDRFDNFESRANIARETAQRKA
ncbi:MAG TPA: hypothetical protein VHV10_20690 [Ktedonobacteraceae bacterium]|jgi:hypothetical protein|nr:hypothetical protein [Ktedonobacteraceae bacterium]